MKYSIGLRMFVWCSTLAAWLLTSGVDAQANMAVAPESVTGEALAGAAAADAAPRKKKKKAPPKAAPSAESPPPQAAAAEPSVANDAADESPREPALPPARKKHPAASASAASDEAATQAASARKKQPTASSSAAADESATDDAPPAPARKKQPTASGSAAADESATDDAPAPARKKHPTSGAADSVDKAAAEPRKKPHSTHSSRSSHATNTHHDRQPDAEYVHLRDSWHAPIAAPVQPAALLDEQGRPPLVIAPVNGGEAVTLTPDRDDGGFDAKDLALAARAFTPPATQKPHPIAPHLLDLVYQAMRHFGAPLVHLISGYRHDRPGSRHTQGRAIDMVIPGVTNDELVAYVRKFGFCGVGIYPKSGFVHLDVRESSFFWLDESLPDERSKGVPILSQEADAMDCAARDRGEAPQTFVPNNDHEDRAAARAYEKRARKRAQAQAQHANKE